MELKPTSNKQIKPLTSKVAVITGAGSGIGRATAIKLAEEGADIVCIDINTSNLVRTTRLCNTLGAKTWHSTVDVSSQKEMEEFSQWLEEHVGCIDIMVNNAGIGFSGGLLDTTFDDWQRVLDVNLWGVIYGSRLMAQLMVKHNREGHIFNVASAAAFAPNRNLSAYATSKAAVNMLTECLRGELNEKGITVTSICPGIVATDIINNTQFAGMSGEQQQQERKRINSLYRNRNLTPEQVANKIFAQTFKKKALSLVGIEAFMLRFLYRFLPSASRKLATIKAA